MLAHPRLNFARLGLAGGAVALIKKHGVGRNREVHPPVEPNLSPDWENCRAPGKFILWEAAFNLSSYFGLLKCYYQQPRGPRSEMGTIPQVAVSFSTQRN